MEGGYIKWPYTRILIQSAKFVVQTNLLDVTLYSDPKPKSKRKNKSWTGNKRTSDPKRIASFQDYYVFHAASLKEKEDGSE